MEPTTFADPNNQVLVLEDDSSIAELITWILAEAGYSVITSSSVAAARRTCFETLPELIIADLALPDGLGTDFIQEMQRTHGANSPPAIIMSALPDAEQHAENAGAVRYLGKPFDLTELLEIVTHLVDTSHSLQTIQRA